MSTSGGNTGNTGLTFANVAVGATLAPNTYNRVTSGVSGNVSLPNGPPTGTQVVVENRTHQAGSNRKVVVLPTGGATIEGSAGLNLSMSGTTTASRCHLVYDGTNWQIMSVDPTMFPIQIGAGGWSDSSSSYFQGDTVFVPRNTGNGNNYVAKTSTSPPIHLPPTPTNIDWFIQTPLFSSGTLSLVSLSFGVVEHPSGVAAPANGLVLNVPGTLPITLASGTIYSGNSFGGLGTWGVAFSAGTDITVDAGGASLNSTAGGWYVWALGVLFLTDSLVP